MVTEACPLCLQHDAEKLGTVDSNHPDMISYRCPRCGNFVIGDLVPYEIEAQWSTERYRLSAAARAASERGQPLEITTDRIEGIIGTVAPNRAVLDRVDRLLLVLADRAGDFWRVATFDTELDYPLIAAKSSDEASYVIDLATQLKFLSSGTYFTAQAWQRVDELRRTQPDSRQAFAAMSFDPSLNDAWWNGIRPGIEDSGYFAAKRADDFQHNEKIDDRIVAEIRRSGLLVADFTGGRGGVYYEAGLAQGLGIPVIWTCQRGSWVKKLHFDTRQYNHIVWDSPEDLRQKLNDRIAATVLPKGLTRPTEKPPA